MNDKQKEFVERTTKHRQERGELISLELLNEMLKGNLPYYDVHYVANRAIKVLETVTKGLDFNNKEIQLARKQYLKTILKESKKQLKKVKPEKDKDVDNQAKYDRCEPIVLGWVEKIMDAKLLMSDQEYLDDVLKDDEMMFFYKLSRGYLDETHNLIVQTLAEHERRANVKMWGVEKENITFEMLDEVLKRK